MWGSVWGSVARRQGPTVTTSEIVAHGAAEGWESFAEAAKLW